MVTQGYLGGYKGGVYPDYRSAYPARTSIERRDLDIQTCFTGDPAAADTLNCRGVVPWTGSTGCYILIAHLGGDIKRVGSPGGCERRDFGFSNMFYERPSGGKHPKIIGV